MGIKRFVVAVMVGALVVLWLHAECWCQGPVNRSLDSLKYMVSAQLAATPGGTNLMSSSRLTWAINRAIAQTCSDWPAIEKLDTVAIDEGDEGAALNSDFDRCKAVYRMGDDIRVPLAYCHPDSLPAKIGTPEQAKQENQAELNSVRFWHTSGKRLLVLPRPDKPSADPDSFLVEYYAQDSRLTTGTDSTAIAQAYMDKVIAYACNQLSAMRKDWASAYFYWSIYKGKMIDLEQLRGM